MGLKRVSSAIHIAFFAAASIACLSAGWAASAKGGAEYLGGTVRVIQPSARGTLDLGDSEELVFHSAASIFRLPYARIRSHHFSDYPYHPRKLAGVRLPAVALLGRGRILEISFQEPDGTLGTASFRIDDRMQSQAEILLSARTLPEQNPPRHSAGAKLPQEWWGDKYWKTNRNKAGWVERQAAESSTLAGTK